MSTSQSTIPSRPIATTEQQGFVGSWLITFFEEDGPPTLALATLGADGTVVTAEHPVVTPPIAHGPVYTSSGHGAWQATGPDSAIITFVGLGSYGEGVLFGTVTANATITLAPDRQAFDGAVRFTIADHGGNTLGTFPGSFRATRITPEAPATGQRPK